MAARRLRSRDGRRPRGRRSLTAPTRRSRCRPPTTRRFSDEELSRPSRRPASHRGRRARPRAISGRRASTSAPSAAGTLADRVRALTLRESNSDPVVALADLRRARAQAGGGPPTIRCQLALALAVALSIAGRAEDALLDALDALACAREARDPKAVGACIALLARLYESAAKASETWPGAGSGHATPCDGARRPSSPRDVGGSIDKPGRTTPMPLAGAWLLARVRSPAISPGTVRTRRER